MKMYLTGGAVRDELLNLPSKDLDYCCLADSFEQLGQYLISEGYEIKHQYSDKFTYRAIAPGQSQVQDYVCCRGKEVYEDGKLVSVEKATLFEDLKRRDFTVNAIAKDLDTEEYIDYFGGVQDCKNRILRCVGDPAERFTEDPRRMIRAIRFIVKCRMTPDSSLISALQDSSLINLLRNPKYKDCVVTEMDKALKMDSGKVCRLMTYYSGLADVIFNPDSLNLHLTLSAKQNKIGRHYHHNKC